MRTDLYLYIKSWYNMVKLRLLEVTMPFCPNCKFEYEKNIEYCSDCGAKLVDRLEEEPESKPEEYDEEVFLTNVANEIQASIIVSKLSAYEIPVMKKYRDEGSAMVVFTGTSLFGVDLYVPSKLLSQAKEILTEDSQIDTDSLEFDKLMDEYGFEDIDNLEFESDDEVKEEEAKEIHLVNKTDPVESPVSPSEKEENSVEASVSEESEDLDNLEEAINRRNKKLRRLSIVIPIILVLIIYLLKFIADK